MARNNTANTTAQRIESIAQRIMDNARVECVEMHNVTTKRATRVIVSDTDRARKIARCLLARVKRGETLFAVENVRGTLMIFTTTKGYWDSIAYGYRTPGYQGVITYGLFRYGRELYTIPQHIRGVY